MISEGETATYLQQRRLRLSLDSSRTAEQEDDEWINVRKQMGKVSRGVSERGTEASSDKEGSAKRNKLSAYVLASLPESGNKAEIYARKNIGAQEIDGNARTRGVN